MEDEIEAAMQRGFFGTVYTKTPLQLPLGFHMILSYGIATEEIGGSG